MDLQRIANLPGCGMADAELRRLGHPKDADKKTYKVKVEWSIGYSKTFKVEANNEAEATLEAVEMAEDTPTDGNFDCVEIHSARITSKEQDE